MARDEYDTDTMNNFVELGRANKKAIPLVKNWCKHIKVIDKSAGLVAEIYNLPTNQTICCPHTTNEFTAANFNWIASDFIIDNCINCSFHVEVSANNYGRPLIARHIAEVTATKQREEEEHQRRGKIKSEIEAVIQGIPSKNKTALLSILKLIQSLDEENEAALAPDKILEASKLSPEFFTEASLDYLSMCFGQENGYKLLEAIGHVVENGTTVSSFAFNNIAEAIKNSSTLDEAAKIIDRLLLDKSFENHRAIFENILQNCDYDDSYGRRHLEDVAYINAAHLYSRLFNSNPKMFNNILETRIKNSDKYCRINCCGFLIDLAAIDKKMIINFTPLLLKSFEFKEDNYGSSADSATRKVLGKIYQHDPQFLLDNIDKMYTHLTTAAKVEVLKFYSKLLSTKLNFDITESHSALIIKKLIDILLKGVKDEVLKEKMLDAIKEISDVRPLEFIVHFDAVLGCLVIAHQDLVTLNWQINDLTGNNATLTFNPLIGKNYYEIDSLKIRAEKAIRITHDIIKNIIKKNPDDFYDKVIKIVLNLDSKNDHALKVSLIDILRGSLTDTVNVSQLLPHIHSFIHDIDSEAVRNSGMKYLVHIIEKHPQIVTQTFVDTIKIFLNDPVILVRGRAIEAYGALIRTLPEYLTSTEVDMIINYITDPYVFIHKEAAKLCYRLYPFLDEPRLNKLTINLIKLEHSYFVAKDFHYCKDVIGYLLFVTKGRPKVFGNVVNKIVVKNCSTKEYYTELHAIEKLTEIATEFEVFQGIWFINAVNFLLHTKPDPYNQDMDKRKKLFAKMHQLKPGVFKKNLPHYTAFLKDRIDKLIFADVKDGYAVLALFCCFDELKTLTTYFSKMVPDDASRAYYNTFNQKIDSISATELNAQIGKLDILTLKTAKGI